MVNRRMFRPGFADMKEQVPPRQHGNSNSNGPAPSKKPAPPELTHAENFYWVKQMQARTQMAIVLENRVRGVPTIQSAIRDSGRITGGFTQQQAEDRNARRKQERAPQAQ